MSDIVERTLVSVQNFIANKPTDTNIGRNFKKFVHSICNASTGSEQDAIINNEMAVLQEQLRSPNLKTHHVRDCLLRSIYCEMLGYPAPFVHIHSIKQAQQGYLAATLLLHQNHELVILIVNTIQKDLRSSNILEICMALTAVPYLISAEMATNVVDLIEEKLSHPKELVRKKAMLALQHIVLVSPSTINHLSSKVIHCLGDSDPEVVSVAIQSLLILVQADAMPYKDLVSTVVGILQQVIDHRLPTDFDYRGIPAPWLQINILKILALIGKNEASVGRVLLNVFQKTIQLVDGKCNIAGAIIYECICTMLIVDISDQALVELAVAAVDRLLHSHNCNMMYMGIKALAQMVQCLPASLLTKHQALIIECINHPDSSIKRKTLDVLIALTNSSNVELVCQKLLGYLASTSDHVGKERLLIQIFGLADRFHQCKKWYFQMTTSVLHHADSVMHIQDIVQKMKKLLLNGENENGLKEEAVVTCLDLLKRRHEHNLSIPLLILATWILGHSHVFHANADLELIVNIISEVASENSECCDVAVNALSALRNLIIYSDLHVEHSIPVIEKCLNSQDFNVRYSALELKRIIINMKSIRPLFTNQETTLKYDWTLSFLDEYVTGYLKAGGAPYKPRSARIKVVSEKETASQEITSGIKLLMLDSSSESLSQSQPSVSSSVESGIIRKNSHPSMTVRDVKEVWSEEGRHEIEIKDSLTQPSVSLVNAKRTNPQFSLDESLVKSLFSDLQQTNTNFTSEKTEIPSQSNPLLDNMETTNQILQP